MNDAQKYIDLYGKEFLKELFDLMFINANRNPDTEQLRSLLIKYKHIKPSTKIILNRSYITNQSNINASFIDLRNGRGTSIIYLYLRPDTFKYIIENL